LSNGLLFAMGLIVFTEPFQTTRLNYTTTATTTLLPKERKFEGVWIPADLWLSKDLTITEKCLLREIESLSQEGYCYASNKHLSEFLGVSVRAVTDLLGKLQTKKLIEITGQKRGRKIYPKRAEFAHKDSNGNRKILPVKQEESSEPSILEKYKNNTVGEAPVIKFDSARFTDLWRSFAGTEYILMGKEYGLARKDAEELGGVDALQPAISKAFARTLFPFSKRETVITYSLVHSQLPALLNGHGKEDTLGPKCPDCGYEGYATIGGGEYECNRCQHVFRTVQR